MSDLLFVYGTLRQGNTNDMATYLANHALFVAGGWFQGQMYQISYYPGVIASDNAHDRVYGEVYRLHDARAALAVLDDYEECSSLHTHPTEYIRTQVKIQAIDGTTLESVWIYIYQRNVAALKLIESGDFTKII